MPAIGLEEVEEREEKIAAELLTFCLVSVSGVLFTSRDEALLFA